MARPISIALCHLIACSCSAVLLAAPPSTDADIETADRLAKIGQYQEADEYLQRVMTSGPASPAREASLLNRRLQLLTEQSLATPWQRREAVWSAEGRLGDDWLAANRDHPRRSLVLLQRGLDALTMGRVQRLEGELLGERSLNDRCRLVLRESLRWLERTTEASDAALGAQYRTTRSLPDALSTDQLLAIKQQARLARAQAYFELALTYPANSSERVDTLTQSLAESMPVARRRDFSQYEFDASVLEILAIAQLGRVDEGIERFGEFTQRWSKLEEGAAARQTRWNELAMRIALVGENWSTAARLAANEEHWGRSDEHDLVALESLLRWRRAAPRDGAAQSAETTRSDQADGGQEATEGVRDNRPPGPAELGGVIERLLHAISKAHPPFVQLRVDLLLARLADPRDTAPPAEVPGEAASVAASAAAIDGANAEAASASVLEAELMARAAEGLLREGQVAAAVAKFDLAAAEAARIGRVDVAFDAAYQAATLVMSQNDYREAARRLRTLAMANLDDPRASHAHLLGLLNLAELARTDAAVMDEYERGLGKHLETWSRGAASDRARIWLAKLLLARAQPRDAVEVVKLVPLESPEHSQALELMTTGVGQYLVTLPNPRQRSEYAVELVGYLENLVTPGDASTVPAPESWTSSQLWTLLTAAWLRVSVLDNGAQQVRPLLEDLMARSSVAAADERWMTRAHLVVALAHAYDERWADVARHLGEIQRANDEDRLTAAEQLCSIGLSLPAERQPAVANVAATLVERATTRDGVREAADSGTPVETRWLECRAIVARLSGDWQAAKQAYDAAVASAPNDVELITRCATWLGQVEGFESAALDRWRRVVELHPQQSDGWWRAKQEIATLLVRQRQYDQANRMIQYLGTLYPEMGGEARRKAFERLNRETRSRKSR